MNINFRTGILFHAKTLKPIKLTKKAEKVLSSFFNVDCFICALNYQVIKWREAKKVLRDCSVKASNKIVLNNIILELNDDILSVVEWLKADKVKKKPDRKLKFYRAFLILENL